MVSILLLSLAPSVYSGETASVDVAKEMRDSGKAMNDAIRAREQKAKTMTVIDDLNPYADLTSLHADSMKKFVTAFSPLYHSMTDEQKKECRYRIHESQIG